MSRTITGPRWELAVAGKAIAACHGVSHETVRRWAARGEFEHYRKTPGGSVEVPVAAYLDFLNRYSFTCPRP